MIYNIKYFKRIAYFLATLVLLQSCIVYSIQSSSIVEATSEEDMPIKIITKNGDKYKLRWIEEKDGNIISIKNVKRKYFDKNDIFQLTILDPQPQSVPIDIALAHHGTVRLLTIDGSNQSSYEFIKIRENDERIIGYKMTGLDTANISIPLDQIEKIQLKDIKRSRSDTAVLVILVAGVSIVIGFFVGMANACADGGCGWS